MLIILALLGVGVLGLAVGWRWHGTVLLGDRATIERLARQLATEQLIQLRTHATLRAMQQAARDQQRSGGAGCE